MGIYKRSSTDRKAIGNWWICFTDHQQIRRQWALGVNNKRAAETMERNIKELVTCKLTNQTPGRDISQWLEAIPVKLVDKLAAADIITTARAASGKKLAEHLDDFKQGIINGGNTPKHAILQYDRVKRVFDGCGFKFWTDINASSIQKFIGTMRQPQADGSDGISSRTANSYLQSCQQFCRFMVDDRRASENPIAYLKPIKIDKNEAIRRRALEVDEVARLLHSTATQPTRANMDGQQRALLYRLAVETGLRASELKSLTAASFDFDNKIVTVEAGYTKNRHTASLPLRADTAEMMQQHLYKHLPGAKAFNISSVYTFSKIIKFDYRAAGIEYQDTGSGKLDFHALRHTFGTLLAASGVHPKTAQDLMRHSDINLTMSRYTHSLRGQQNQAIASLPDFTARADQEQKKTGTDDISCDVIEAKGIKKKQNYVNSKECSKICSKGSSQQPKTVDNAGQRRALNTIISNQQKTPFTSEKQRFQSENGAKKQTHPTGFEPVAYGLEMSCRKFVSVENKGLTKYDNSSCSCICSSSGKIDPDLRKVCQAWERLTDAEKSVIMKLVKD